MSSRRHAPTVGARSSGGGGAITPKTPSGRHSAASAIMLFVAGVTIGFVVPRIIYFQVLHADESFFHTSAGHQRSTFLSRKDDASSNTAPGTPSTQTTAPATPVSTDNGASTKNDAPQRAQDSRTPQTGGSAFDLLFPSGRPDSDSASGMPDPPSVGAPGDKLENCREAKSCRQKALVFTMDSIQSRIDESKKGGASGEMTIRIALQNGLASLGVDCFVARSDAEFESQDMSAYNLIFLDPWTWAGRGWVLKGFLRGHTDKIFLLDFFGGDGHTALNGLVPLSRHLTAFPVNPKNTFLGYYVENQVLVTAREEKKKATEAVVRGVIWGKDPKYYKGMHNVLEKIASRSHLVSTAPESALPRHQNIESVGHQTPEGWNRLLSTSKFLVGLGDPLVGPSAIDAITSGVMFLNPHYDSPKLQHYHSQHPFAEQSVPSHVCGFNMNEPGLTALQGCVERALGANLPPLIPKELTVNEYLKRLQKIFGSHLKTTGT
mmetsp:Transcript_28369/g.69109  ORF Transcript_28369/g.69109 Transcript_28369/m.69109 type:complete len:491 (+) Transcript_28369:103-1575(+)